MFERLKNIAKAYVHLIVFGVLSVVLIFLLSELRISKKEFISNFQEKFSEQEQELYTLVPVIANDWNELSRVAFDKKYVNANSRFFIHVYSNDSLIYWNTNQLPVSSFADLHFPTDGLVHLQNGWYFSKTKQIARLKLVVSFGIQQTYPYENAQLKSRFFDPFGLESAIIHIDGRDEHMVYNRQKEPLFRLELAPNQTHGETLEVFVFILVLLQVVVAWHWLRLRSRTLIWRLFLVVCLGIVRYVSFHWSWFDWMSETVLFEPQLLALNEWIPNLGELILWSLFVLLTVLSFQQIIGWFKWRKWHVILVSFLSPLLILSAPLFAIIVVENSSIPLQLNEILALNKYSLVVLFMIGVGGWAFVAVHQWIYMLWNEHVLSLKQKLFLLFSVVLLPVVTVAWYCHWELSFFLWPFLVAVAVFLVIVVSPAGWNFTSVLSILLLFTIATTLNIQREAIEKEHQERELYAKQLSDDRDINVEVEFLAAKEKLLNEPYLKRLFSADTRPGFSEFKEAMERRVFTGFWERYDVDCYYFLGDSLSVKMNGKSMADLNAIISKHGTVSETDSSLFFVRDYTSQYSYVFREKVVRDGQFLWLIGTMKSKRIPEEIGFPRLLISDQANVFESLEDYSIAKYYKGKLVTNYGDFAYPSGFGRLVRGSKGNEFWFERDGFNHFLYQRTKTDAIILSKENTSILEWVTTVAFLLVGYGVFLSVFIWIYRKRSDARLTHFTMATKIQFVMISLVVISLVGFSFGSSTFVTNQYTDYNNDLIRDKIRAVNREAGIRYTEVFRLKDLANSGELDYQLRSWAKIFTTDLNVYSLNGQLIASSRPKIYNIGLLSEQMHPDAMHALLLENNSEFIHEESIGDLSYLSAYVPFKNADGLLIGYLNVQHFDQQSIFENQLQRFFIAIINVFMLLLVFSIIGAIAVSSWITSPLRLIRRSFSRVEFGKNNQRIHYNSKDEIGELIREYNAKLEELEVAALQLAQTERESAWREMAKQVAHEIKNPLTPMKLSIQQLQRVFDPNDPNALQKVQRVSQSIIEQIDALTTIANAFASFAKLPQPIMERIDLAVLLTSVSSFFDADEVGKIHIDAGTKSVFVNGDREMLLRVLNNLISNGIQALAIHKKAEINVRLSVVNGTAEIRVRDNGQGIPDEQCATIFEPYFTTKSTGTGLGLAMVKQIIESHSGTIQIAETGGKGTTMLVTLPVLQD